LVATLTPPPQLCPSTVSGWRVCRLRSFLVQWGVVQQCFIHAAEVQCESRCYPDEMPTNQVALIRREPDRKSASTV
jgi:hypothetical protein